MIETSQTRKESIDKGTVLWRAQRELHVERRENAGTEEEFDVPDAFGARTDGAEG